MVLYKNPQLSCICQIFGGFLSATALLPVCSWVCKKYKHWIEESAKNLQIFLSYSLNVSFHTTLQSCFHLYCVQPINQIKYNERHRNERNHAFFKKLSFGLFVDFVQEKYDGWFKKDSENKKDAHQDPLVQECCIANLQISSHKAFIRY